MANIQIKSEKGIPGGTYTIIFWEKFGDSDKNCYLYAVYCVKYHGSRSLFYP